MKLLLFQTEMTTIVKEDIKILQTLKKHTNDVTSCDFTPNFSIVTGSR